MVLHNLHSHCSEIGAEYLICIRIVKKFGSPNIPTPRHLTLLNPLSVCPSVRQIHLLAQRALLPSAGAIKKPPGGGLNFLVLDNKISSANFHPKKS